MSSSTPHKYAVQARNLTYALGVIGRPKGQMPRTTRTPVRSEVWRARQPAEGGFALRRPWKYEMNRVLV